MGFVEYKTALQHFDQLLRSASQEELRVMDQLVRRDPQYSFYVNLTRRMPQATRSAFAPSVNSVDVRQGLAWVAALARIELGAILAAFTNERTPFPLPRRGAPESQAFDALLLEAALLHVWSLQTDPLVTGQRKPKLRKGLRQRKSAASRRLAKQRFLAYERRISLAWKLLQAARLRIADKMSQQQRSEFAYLLQQTNQLRTRLRKDLLGLGVSVRGDK